MKTFGEVKAVETAIEEKYSGRAKELENEKRRRLAEISSAKEKELKLIKANAETQLAGYVKEARARAMIEEKLAAQKDYEQARESLINQAFEKMLGKAKETASGKEYQEFVKRQRPEEHGLKEEKTSSGVKFIGKDIAWDFTIEGLLEAEHDMIRRTLSRQLFG